jgi:hypothetical protein
VHKNMTHRYILFVVRPYLLVKTRYTANLKGVDITQMSMVTANKEKGLGSPFRPIRSDYSLASIFGLIGLLFQHFRLIAPVLSAYGCLFEAKDATTAKIKHNPHILLIYLEFTMADCTFLQICTQKSYIKSA